MTALNSGSEILPIPNLHWELSGGEGKERNRGGRKEEGREEKGRRDEGRREGEGREEK